MTRNDVEPLAELDKRCFAIPWSKQAFAEEMSNEIAVYFVAKENGKVIGYCGFWQVADEGDVTNIAVLPEFRRRGIGGKLLNTLIEAAKELKLELITLEVRKSNTAAKNLYKKYGFKPIGERKHYYSDNREDAVIMMKRLKTDE